MIGWSILIAALAARLWVALTRLDMIWADEHFQTLEPAAKAVFGYGTMSWEWEMGYRPWVVPALYMPLFYVCKLFGVSGAGVILASRALTAIASLGVLVSLDRLLRLSRISSIARFLALAAYALSVPMILWSCATLADTWAMIAVWGVMPIVLARLTRPKSDTSGRGAAPTLRASDGVVVGMLIGIPALIKIQLLCWVAGFAATLASASLIAARNGSHGTGRRAMRLSSRGFWFAFAAGLALDGGALGFFDWLTLGSFLKSAIQQIQTGNSISLTNGTSPAWQYLKELMIDPGVPLLACLAALTAISLVTELIELMGLIGLIGLRASAPDSRPASRFRLIDALTSWIVSLPLVGLFVFFSVLPHKELRFVLPVFPLFYFWLGCLLDRCLRPAFAIIRQQVARVRSFVPVAPSAVLAFVLCAGLTSVAAKEAGQRPVGFTPVDTSALERQVAEQYDGGCLILLEHPWPWTRGQLILGAAVEVLSKSKSELAALRESGRLAECRHAILPAGEAESFRSVAGPEWSQISASAHGHLLFRREGPKRTPASR